jgi:hypothetical protein
LGEFVHMGPGFIVTFFNLVGVFEKSFATADNFSLFLFFSRLNFHSCENLFHRENWKNPGNIPLFAAKFRLKPFLKTFDR